MKDLYPIKFALISILMRNHWKIGNIRQKNTGHIVVILIAVLS